MKSSCFLLSLAGLVAANLVSAQEFVIQSDTADGEATRNFGGFNSWAGSQVDGTAGSPFTGLLADATIRVGRRGNDIISSFVVPFQLPDVGTVSNPFTAASFAVTVDGGTTTAWSVSLHALGRRSTATINGTDFFVGDTGRNDPTDSTTLDAAFITSGATLTGGQTLSYSASALSDYLNTAYASGAGAGEFVFIRLSAVGANTGISSNQITFRTGNFSGTASDPTLTLTAIPEPSSSAALAGFGLLGWAVMRRRARR